MTEFEQWTDDLTFPPLTVEVTMQSRRADESYRDYRIRRAILNASFKQRQRPRLLWDSERRGTYIRKQHGAL